MTLREVLQQAQNEGFAIGQFNVSNSEASKAVVQAAVRLRSPVIIGASEGERAFFGVNELVAVVKAYREESDLPIFLNADHTKSFEKIKEAVEAGFDSVHFDGSTLPYEENISETRKAVEYAREINPTISVEGELGYLRGASKVQEVVKITESDFTKPGEAKDFVEKTGVDRLAVVFGNIHGRVTKGEEKLNLKRLEEIRVATNAFLVLHGGSGISDPDIRGAIERGIVKVNVNTDLRVAQRESLEKTLEEFPAETTPYKLFEPVVEEIQKVVEGKIQLFGSANRA